MATSRPYRIEAPAGVRVVKADDRVASRMDVPPIPGIGRLIREDLEQRGFKDAGGGNISRERNGVRVTMNPDDGSLTMEAGGEIQVPPGPPGVCGCRIARELAAANAAADDLQKQVTGRLAQAIPATGCELERAIHRAAKKAIRQVAESIGTVRSIEEGADGSMTVRVTVEA